MWAIIGTVCTGAIISFFEIPPLIKKKCWKEIVIHFIAFSWHDIKYFNNQGYYHSDPYRLDNENI